MRKRALFTLFLFIGLFILSACGNKNSNTLKGIQEKLHLLESYKQLQEYSNYTDKLVGDTLTISVDNDYDKGSYNFTIDGDYITLTAKKDDISAAIIYLEIAAAVAEYNNMDSALVKSYINAVFTDNLEDKYAKHIEKDDKEIYSFYIADQFDLSLLDSISIKEKDLEFFDAFKESTSFAGSKGNFIYRGYGDSKESYIIFGQRNGFNDNAYDNLLVLIKHFYPKEYNNFTKNYTKIEEKSFGKFSINYLTNEEEIEEVFGDSNTKNYKLIKINYSK